MFQFLTKPVQPRPQLPPQSNAKQTFNISSKPIPVGRYGLIFALKFIVCYCKQTNFV